jgi:DNA polymerase
MYYGASTGRWSGKRIQPHNMPRKMPDDFEGVIATVKDRDLETLELLYGDPMQALSGSIRGFICAAPGYDLICADYSSIEGRVLAWLAKEDYIVQNYYDGKDAYCVFASQITGLSYDEILNGHQKKIKKYEEVRFEGKTGELACGFQGGEAAIKRFAPDMLIERRKKIVYLWRSSRPMTIKFWIGMERYAKSAIQTGKTYTWNNIKWGMSNGFLHCRLPSGRLLSYYKPSLRMKDTPWGEPKATISFMGVDSITKRWERQYTYGGMLVQNIVQAVARDLLAEALVRLEDKGYPVVLHVHDEAIGEVPEGTGSVNEFVGIMSAIPQWAIGCPIEAEGFRTKRYRKG